MTPRESDTESAGGKKNSVIPLDILKSTGGFLRVRHAFPQLEGISVGYHIYFQKVQKNASYIPIYLISLQ